MKTLFSMKNILMCLASILSVTITAPAENSPEILGITADAAAVTFRLAGIPDSVYQAQASTNLLDWVNIGWASADTNGLFQCIDGDKYSYAQRFYRVRQSQLPSVTIASISDVHYMDPSLLIADGTAFQTYLAQDRKMLAQSKALLEAALAGISNARPKLLLVTGDLTKDGERVSHLAVSNYLWGLKLAGMKVFVCPGNHDVNNPQAMSFDGTNTTLVPSVSQNEFASIYAPFGFTDAIARDPHSLSYVVEPVPGLWILSMDSCRYDLNTGGVATTGGSFDDLRWNFITNQLAVARAQGKFVIGMEHHPIMEHFAGMQALFPEYVLTNYAAVNEAFANYGLKIVFTGHFHAQDIIQTNLAAGSLVDVETGSTVTYPSPYRIMSLATNGVLTVHSYPITNINYDLGGQDFPAFAKEFLQQGLLGLSTYMLTAPPYNVPLAQAQQLAPAMSEAFLAHYQGDENPLTVSPQTLGTIAYLQSQTTSFLDQFMAYELNAIFHDPPPSDNHLTINLVTDSVAP